MKRLLVFLVLVFSSTAALAEKTTFDLVRYTAPAPWKKTAWKREATKTIVTYSSVDKSNGTYCQIFIVRSTASKGDLTSDFDSEWKELIVSSYKLTEAAQATDAAEEDGWQVKSGVATFAFDKGTSIALLTSISGYGRVTSIVAVTSSKDYLPAVQALLGSVEMIKRAAEASATAKPATKSTTAKPTALQGYMDYNPITQSWTWKVRYPPK